MDLLLAAAIGTGSTGVFLWLVTQIHLRSVAKKLIKKSDASWDQAHREIAEVKSEVLSEMRKISQSSGGNELDSRIQELDSKIVGAFNQFSEKLVFTMDQFGNGLNKQLETLLTLPSTKLGGSPVDAQAESVASRHAKKIVSEIRAQALGPEIQQLADFLHFIGKPDLAEKLQEHPGVIQFVMSQINNDRFLRGRLGQFMGARSVGPGNHPGGPI